jgi:hypothetical protein
VWDKDNTRENGGSIRFSLQGGECEGTIGVDEIRLTEFRQDTGNCFDQTYRFAPVSAAF